MVSNTTRETRIDLEARSPLFWSCDHVAATTVSTSQPEEIEGEFTASAAHANGSRLESVNSS